MYFERETQSPNYEDQDEDEGYKHKIQVLEYKTTMSELDHVLKNQEFKSQQYDLTKLTDNLMKTNKKPGIRK